MVDRTCHHEERALEQCMRDEIERRAFQRMRRAEAGQHHQQPERGNGRIGEHQLEIGLTQPDHSAGQQRGSAEDGQDRFPGGCVAKGRLQPHQQEHAGFHHGRRMQIGRNRGGGLHRVRQPEMERKLRRLGEGAAEDQQERREIVWARLHRRCIFDEQRNGAHTGHVPDENEAREQRQPAAARHHERLDRRPARGFP